MKLERILVLIVVAAVLLAATYQQDVWGFRKEVRFYSDDQGYLALRSNCVTATTNSGAGTQVITGVFPARVLPLGLTLRVNTTIAGASLTTFNVGDGTDADLYGAAIATTAGTTVGTANYTARPTTQAWSTSAGNITLTALAGQFDSGNVTACGHYMTFVGPTS